ncbi:MAG: hypothetical protein HYW07_05895 [Candidatus Latescibacteria bacterium]|nr:hypothetical protein [Candidatus Latescibacterota bacterium]
MKLPAILGLALLLLLPAAAWAEAAGQVPVLLGLRVEFIPFGLTLAGVALSTRFPQVRSVGAWLRCGWHVGVGYVLGFLLMLWLMGWHPLPGK